MGKQKTKATGRVVASAEGPARGGGGPQEWQHPGASLSIPRVQQHPGASQSIPGTQQHPGAFPGCSSIPKHPRASPGRSSILEHPWGSAASQSIPGARQHPGASPGRSSIPEHPRGSAASRSIPRGARRGRAGGAGAGRAVLSLEGTPGWDFQGLLRISGPSGGGGWGSAPSLGLASPRRTRERPGPLSPASAVSPGVHRGAGRVACGNDAPHPVRCSTGGGRAEPQGRADALGAVWRILWHHLHQPWQVHGRHPELLPALPCPLLPRSPSPQTRSPQQSCVRTGPRPSAAPRTGICGSCRHLTLGSCGVESSSRPDPKPLAFWGAFPPSRGGDCQGMRQDGGRANPQRQRSRVPFASLDLGRAVV